MVLPYDFNCFVEWEKFRPEDGNYFAVDVNVTSGLTPKNALHYEE